METGKRSVSSRLPSANRETWRDSMMIWDTISLKSAGPVIFLHIRINTRDYLKTLSDHVHHIAQVLFQERNTIFKDDNATIHTARIVEE